MRLCIVTSWYPNHHSNIEGCFIRDQAIAIKQEHTDWQVIVSYAEPYHIRIFKPIETFNEIKNFFSSKFKIVTENGVVVLRRRYLSNVLYKNGRGLLKCHYKNYEYMGGCDLIHAHVSYPGGFVAYMIKQKYGTHYEITEHMSPFPFSEYIKDDKLSPLIIRALGGADHIIAVSDYQKRCIEKYGFKNVEVIPNVIL